MAEMKLVEGDWVDAVTGEVVVPAWLPRKETSAVIAALFAAGGMASVPARADQNQGRRRRAMEKQAELRQMSTAVEAHLEAMWSWCNRHPDHPQIEQRIDRMLARLRVYEVLQDVLRRIDRMVFADVTREAA